jgi:hypothetical protein
MHTAIENKFYITQPEQTARLIFQYIQNIYYIYNTHYTHMLAYTILPKFILLLMISWSKGFLSNITEYGT